MVQLEVQLSDPDTACHPSFNVVLCVHSACPPTRPVAVWSPGTLYQLHTPSHAPACPHQAGIGLNHDTSNHHALQAGAEEVTGPISARASPRGDPPDDAATPEPPPSAPSGPSQEAARAVHGERHVSAGCLLGLELRVAWPLPACCPET